MNVKCQTCQNHSYALKLQVQVSIFPLFISFFLNKQREIDYFFSYLNLNLKFLLSEIIIRGQSRISEVPKQFIVI